MSTEEGSVGGRDDGAGASAAMTGSDDGVVEGENVWRVSSRRFGVARSRPRRSEVGREKPVRVREERLRSDDQAEKGRKAGERSIGEQVGEWKECEVRAR